MDPNCEVVQDLMPLALDGACSPESKRLVEEHVARCPACKSAWEELEQELPDAPEPLRPERNSAEVLKRTARTVSLRTVRAAVGITAIVLVWLFYLWQEMLADQGNYRYFSYSFHEMCAVVLAAAVLITWIWLAVLLWRSLRRRAWRQNGILLLALAALVCGQWYYFYQAQETSYTAAAEVVAISDYGRQVEIRVGEEYRTLESIPLISNLLETDGTLYLLDYTEPKAHPGRYQLEYVWEIVEPGSGVSGLKP